MTERSVDPTLEEASLSPLPKVFSDEQLALLLDDVINSGALGRSKIFKSLFRFLIDCASRNHIPKEIEIAIDVLQKDVDFDVAKDSSVRVYIHQLRKKLDAYFEEHGPFNGYVISIPKGQYQLLASAYKAPIQVPTQVVYQHTPSKVLILTAIVLLAANLGFWLLHAFFANSTDEFSLSENSIWQPLIASELPVLVVMGDYYIFGELDEAGNISRMVREFDINSAEDLDSHFAENPQLAWQYYDLDLTYIPEGGALALSHVLPALRSSGKRVEMKMMSTLSTEDIRENNIVYIGYVSGLAELSSWVFAASHYEVGANFDELLEKHTGESFVSDAGLPAQNRAFVDYGLISRIQLSSNTHLLSVSGLRDAGLSEAAEQVVQPVFAKEISEQMSKGLGGVSFEALIEVRGMDRANFSSSLIKGYEVEASRIWEAAVTGP